MFNYNCIKNVIKTLNTVTFKIVMILLGASFITSCMNNTETLSEAEIVEPKVAVNIDY